MEKHTTQDGFIFRDGKPYAVMSPNHTDEAEWLTALLNAEAQAAQDDADALAVVDDENVDPPALPDRIPIDKRWGTGTNDVIVQQIILRDCCNDLLAEAQRSRKELARLRALIDANKTERTPQ